jgi:hypothetical protein
MLSKDVKRSHLSAATDRTRHGPWILSAHPANLIWGAVRFNAEVSTSLNSAGRSISLSRASDQDFSRDLLEPSDERLLPEGLRMRLNG